MVKIPRTEESVGLRMADQPTMPTDLLTGPGRALQGLGKAISGLQGAFDAMSQPGDQDVLTAQLAQMDASVESEKYFNERVAAFTPETDPDSWHQETTKGINSIWDDASAKVPAFPKLQQGFGINRHRFTGNYDVRAHGLAVKEKTGRYATGALETMRRGMENADPTTPEGVAIIDTIERQLGRIPGVDVERARGALADSIVEKFKAEAEQDPLKALEKIEAIEKWREQFKVRPQGVGPQSSVTPRLMDDQKASLDGVKPEVVSKFAELQGALGRTFKINSGYRDPEHNERVGGAKNSQHIHRNAIDIDVRDLSHADRVKVIEQASALGFQGIGVYKNAIHLDMGRRRTWGPSFGRGSVPGWAEDAVSAHERGRAVATASGVGGDSDIDFRSRGGPASIRYNNPGAMYPGPSSKKYGAVGTEIIGGGHKIAVFPDAISGAAAQFDLLSEKYTGRTLQSAISRWSGGNSVGTYLKVIERETGLSADTVLTREMVADPKIAIPIAKAMAVQEAGKTYPMSDANWADAHRRFSGDAAPPVSERGVAQVAGSVKVASIANEAYDISRIGVDADGEPTEYTKEIGKGIHDRLTGKEPYPPGALDRQQNTIPGQGTQVAQGGMSPQEFVRQQKEAQERAVPGQVRTQNEVWDQPSIRTHVLDKISGIRGRIEKLAEKQMAAMEGALRVSRFLTREETFNRYDDDARKLVNDTFKMGDLHTRILAGDGDAIVRGVEVSKRLGYVPEVIQDSLLGMVKDRSPSNAKLRMAAYQAAGSVLADYPDAFMGEDGKKLADEARDFLAMADGMGADEALLRIDEMKSPEWEKKKAVLGPIATEKLKSLDPISIMRSALDESILPFNSPGADQMTALMVGDFQERFRNNFMRVGDEASAKKLTLDEMRRTYGVTQISGSAQIMRFPVEKHYPAIGPKGHEYISKDIETSVRAYLDDKAGKSEVGAANESKGGTEIKMDQIFLHGDHVTARDLAAGRSPTYQVWYRDKNGTLQMIPDRIMRWSMQPKDIQAQQSKYRTEQMSKRNDVLGGVSPKDLDAREAIAAEDKRLKGKETASPYAPSVLLREGAKRLKDYLSGSGDLPDGAGVSP